MHQISIVFGPTGTTWALLFKSAEKADEARNTLKTARDFAKGVIVTVSDDFGQQADLLASAIVGVMLESLDDSQQATIERGIHHARTQVKAQSRAQADPLLKTARMSGGGPAVLSPHGMNGSGF